MAEACAIAKAAGNTAYAAGELAKAATLYSEALDSWNEAVAAIPKPKTFSVGDRVLYDGKGFGKVESAYALMDEYFLRDLGTDQAIWVAEIGRDLKRFSRSDLQPVTQELFDLRLACAQNLAAVRLKQEEYDEAIEWAVEALKMDGNSPKALLRKGAALLKSGRAGPASDVLMLLLKISPKDPEAKKLLREAEKAREPNWVCASGCCGPWGIQNHMLAQQSFTNTNAKANNSGNVQFSGPTTAGLKIGGDDSDSDCSSCSGENEQCSKKEQDCSSCSDENEQCSKKEQSSLDSTQAASPREPDVASDSPPRLESLSLEQQTAEKQPPIEETSELRLRAPKHGVQEAVVTETSPASTLEASESKAPERSTSRNEATSFLSCCKRRN